MQHLATDPGLAWTGPRPQTIEPVAEHGVTERVEVLANLVRSASLCPDQEMTGIAVTVKGPDIRHGSTAVNRRRDGPVRRIEVSLDYHVILFLHLVPTEAFHKGIKRLLCCGNEQAARRIAVDPMSHGQVRKLKLVPKTFLRAVRTVRQDSGRFVDNEAMIILKKNFDWSLCATGAFRIRNVYSVARSQLVTGHPHTAAVNEQVSRVEKPLGFLPRKTKTRGQKRQKSEILL